jgi:hypothetical protein
LPASMTRILKKRGTGSAATETVMVMVMLVIE